MLSSHPHLSTHRREFRDSIGNADIERLVADHRLRTLQTRSPVDRGFWRTLNEHFFARRPDVELRVYGSCNNECDLSFAPCLTNVRRFSADCLQEASGVEHLAEMGWLESLDIGIRDLESFDFLSKLPTTSLQRLSLSATRSKKPSIAMIGRFSELRELYLEGQQKDIESISELAKLERLTLRSIRSLNLDFLSKLNRLWWLAIKLGGALDLSAVQGLAGLKYLELWQVRGLADISVVSSLVGLQFLILQSLPHVRSLPDFSRLTSLRRIHLDTMRSLEDFTSLATARSLTQFIHTSANQFAPSDYPLLDLPELREVFVGSGSARRNSALNSLLAARGIAQYTHQEFQFT